MVQLLSLIFRSAQDLGLPVSVCGELAGDRRFTRLLLALGLRELSMQPRNLLEVKQVVIETDIGRARKALQEWMDAPAAGRDASLAHHLDRSQMEL